LPTIHIGRFKKEAAFSFPEADAAIRNLSNPGLFCVYSLCRPDNPIFILLYSHNLFPILLQISSFFFAGVAFSEIICYDSPRV